jgi:protease YdgD
MQPSNTPEGVARVLLVLPFCQWNRRFACAALALLAVAGWMGTASADDHLQTGIIGEDNREIVKDYAAPWTAIGHVNAGGERRNRNFCTGTLIAPDVVLTAAHCVMSPFKDVPLPARDVHFVAGVRKDTSLGHSRGKCIKFAPGFKMRAPDRILPDIGMQLVGDGFFKGDLAVIVLEEEIAKAGTATLAGGQALMPGTGLVHAGYGSDRRYMLSADRACKVMRIEDGVAATTCDSRAGSSGGPVFADEAGELKLAAVLVGTLRKTEATLAVPVGEWEGLPLDGSCP